MRTERQIKHVVFLILGILVIIFSKILFDHLDILVGSIMLLYSGYDLLEKLLVKEFAKNKLKLIDDALIILLGLIVISLKADEHFVTICIIWSVWSIIREEWEIAEEVFTYEKILFVRVLNFLESGIVIVLSVALIFNPTEHHAMLHVHLLGIELVLDMVFPLIEFLLQKIIHRNKNIEQE